MKVAVTGAAGHIGGVLCRELINSGYEVNALVHHDTRALEGLKVNLVKGNILDKTSLSNLMNSCQAVFHVAGKIELSYKFSQSLYDINVIGTQNVLKVAMEAGVEKLIYFGSIDAFDAQPAQVVLDENRTWVNDDSLFYGVTKRDAHQSVLKAAKKGLHAVAVCPTAVLGPYDFKPSKLGKAILDIWKGKIPAVVKGGFDFVDVRDIAKGAVLAMQKGNSGETFILGNKYYSLQDFANTVLEIRGKNRRLMQLPSVLADIGLPFVQSYAAITRKEPLYDRIYLDILRRGNKNILSDKARDQLGYISRDLKESLSDTIAWFKAVGKI